MLADDPDALLLLLAADHAMIRPAAFLDAVARARAAAEAGCIVTFGINPDRPETGYGDVLAGRERDEEPGVHTAPRFAEKPEPRSEERRIGHAGVSESTIRRPTFP